MSRDKKLEEVVGKDAGFRVPDNYFDGLYRQMMENLPERPEPIVHEVSKWQKFKPYLYLAAMFAGIWCMMKMFHMMSTTPQDEMFNNASVELLAEASQREMDYEEIMPEYSDIDFELESEVSEQYTSFNELEEAFGYDLEPQYANMKI